LGRLEIIAALALLIAPFIRLKGDIYAKKAPTEEKQSQ
jgi:hypothetical protein